MAPDRLSPAAALLLGGLGCASVPEPFPPAAISPATVASDAIDAERFDEAREQIRALKALPQNRPLRETLRSLEERLQAKELIVQMQKQSTLTVEPAAVAGGRTVTVTLRLKNPGPSALRIPPRSSGIPLLGGSKQGGMVGRLILLAQNYDPYGNQVRDRTVKTFSVEEGIEIPPEEAWTQVSSVQVPQQENYALRVFSLLCELRPDRLETHGDSLAGDVVTIGPVGFRAFPEGYEKLQENPLQNLRKAIAAPEEKFDPHVFLAAVLMPEGDRKAAVRECIGALSHPSATRRRSLMAALSLLTSAKEPFFEERRWLAWWIDHRTDYEEARNP